MHHLPFDRKQNFWTAQGESSSSRGCAESSNRQTCETRMLRQDINCVQHLFTFPTVWSLSSPSPMQSLTFYLCPLPCKRAWTYMQCALTIHIPRHFSSCGTTRKLLSRCGDACDSPSPTVGCQGRIHCQSASKWCRAVCPLLPLARFSFSLPLDQPLFLLISFTGILRDG